MALQCSSECKIRRGRQSGRLPGAHGSKPAELPGSGGQPSRVGPGACRTASTKKAHAGGGQRGRSSHGTFGFGGGGIEQVENSAVAFPLAVVVFGQGVEDVAEEGSGFAACFQ